MAGARAFRPGTRYAPRLGRGALSSPRSRGGFTLIEMLVVISIIIIVGAITIPMFMSTGATTRRNDATNAVRAAFASARQAAIERRTKVAVEFVCNGNVDAHMRGDKMIVYDKSKPGILTDTLRVIGQPTMLPDFILLDITSTDSRLDPADANANTIMSADAALSTSDILLGDVSFLPDGTVAGGQVRTVTVLDMGEAPKRGTALRYYNTLTVLYSGVVSDCGWQ